MVGKRSYRRVDEWARSLSRGEYAAASGVAAFLSALLVHLLFGEFTLLNPIVMALTLAAVTYWVRPRS